MAPTPAAPAIPGLPAAVALALHAVLRDPASVRHVPVDALAPALLLNMALPLPVFRLARTLLPPLEHVPRAREVELLG